MAAPQKQGRLKLGRPQEGSQVYQQVRRLNKVYEETITTGANTHDFNTDFGYNAVKGWIICDGGGDIQVDFTRDGTIFGEKWTMKEDELVDLDGLDIDSIRVTFVSANASYRITLF